MRKFDKALIQALKVNAKLAELTKVSATNLSICMVEAKQKHVKPSVLCESDQRPLPGADSSRLKEATVSLHACGKTRSEAKELGDAIHDLFFDEEKKEKRFDISNQEVYCIGSYWESLQNPVFDKDLDCERVTVLVTFKWSEK